MLAFREDHCFAHHRAFDRAQALVHITHQAERSNRCTLRVVGDVDRRKLPVQGDAAAELPRLVELLRLGVVDRREARRNDEVERS